VGQSVNIVQEIQRNIFEMLQIKKGGRGPGEEIVSL
jgi:hypothetical protein